MRKAEIAMETPLATDVGWCSLVAATRRGPGAHGGSLVDQLATHDRRCSGDLCDGPGHSRLAAVEPREKGQARAAHRVPPSIWSRHGRNRTRLS